MSVNVEYVCVDSAMWEHSCFGEDRHETHVAFRFGHRRADPVFDPEVAGHVEFHSGHWDLPQRFGTEVMPGGCSAGELAEFFGVDGWWDGFCWWLAVGLLEGDGAVLCLASEFLESGCGDGEAVPSDAEGVDVEVGAECREFGGAFVAALAFDAGLEFGAFVGPVFLCASESEVLGHDLVAFCDFGEGGPADLAVAVGDAFDVFGFEAGPVVAASFAVAAWQYVAWVHAWCRVGRGMFGVGHGLVRLGLPHGWGWNRDSTEREVVVTVAGDACIGVASGVQPVVVEVGEVVAVDAELFHE
jgi:hypothetical protein